MDQHKSGSNWGILPRRSLLLALIALLTITSALACVGGFLSDEPPEEAEAPVVQSVAAGDSSATPDEIEVKARLVFPLRTELTFERAGEVEEILVEPGQMVKEGQTLARLNSEHFPALEEEIVRLNYQIAEARENIKMINLDYSGEPLFVAQREETVARLELANTQADNFFEDIDENHDDRVTAAASELDQARLALVLARDELDKANRDLGPNQSQIIAAAEQAKADAEVALDQANERVADYREDLSDDAIRARDRLTETEVALDQAMERLEDYKEDLEQDVVRARDRVTEAELALEIAKDILNDFLGDHDRLVIRARTEVGAADEAVDAAKRPLTQFLRSPIRDVEVDGKPVDIVKFRTLQAAVDLAEADLVQAREDLAELEEGPDSFRVEELQSNVTVAELNLAQAREDLAELEEGPDPILLQELESNVTIAKLNHESAREDLLELEEGPDVLVLNQLQSQVELATVNLAQARKRLNEEMEGPDPLIVPRLELNIALAELRLDLAEDNLRELEEDGPNRDSVPLMEHEIVTRLAQIDQLYEGPDSLQLAQIESLNATIMLALDRIGDIEEEMDEYSLVAPFDGMVYLVNVEEDDRVNKHSLVMEILDPNEVMVEGFVDAADRGYVSPGARALLNIESLQGEQVPGSVVYVAEDPRTERGVISYFVRIEVELSGGIEIPVRLTAVDAVIIP